MASRILALTALLAAFVVAGCGGGDQLTKDEYIKELNSAGKALSTSFNSLGEGISDTKDTKGLGAKFTEASNALRKASDQIGDINPPDDAKDANDKLAGGLGKMADSFDEVGKASSSSNASQSAALLTKINKLATSDGIKQVTEAINSLKTKGYNISGQ